MLDYEGIENKIRDALSSAKSDGWRVAPGYTISRGSRRCCLMGGVAVASGYRGDDSYEAREIASAWMQKNGIPCPCFSYNSDIEHGFEGRDPQGNSVADMALWSIGRRLRDAFRDEQSIAQPS